MHVPRARQEADHLIVFKLVLQIKVINKDHGKKKESEEKLKKRALHKKRKKSKLTLKTKKKKKLLSHDVKFPSLIT